MMFSRAPMTSLLVLTMLAAVHCGGAPEDVENTAEALSGDPQAGYRYLVNGGYIGTGIPADLVKSGEAMMNIPVVGPLLGNAVVDSMFPLAKGEVFGAPGIPGREGPNADLNYRYTQFTTARGNDVIMFSCLTCHVEQIRGQAIVGLGATTRDYTSDAGVAARAILLAAQVRGRASEITEAEIFAQRFGAMAPYIKTTTVGVNPAINLTWALMAHRDPVTLAWSDEALIEPPPEEALPYDVPAWWHMKYRATDFHSGEIKFHQGAVMLASLLGTETAADLEKLMAPFADVTAFIRQLEPPRYPGHVDETLAAGGSRVYAEHCAGCHGTHEGVRQYPERIIPVDVVGTDPAAAEQEILQSARFYDWIDRSPYGRFVRGGTAASKVLGYLAPPLDGVWATAPYFHNGSVPTLEAVLDSSKRPQYWTRSFDSMDYDVENVGWRFQALDSGKGGLFFFTGQDKYIYDTTEHGYSNSGHTFGDALGADERRALIEYLKTL